MLEIRTTCGNCEKKLPNYSPYAMICTYKCTFCKNCVDNILFNICPNCGGGFEKRSTRPKEQLIKNPTRKETVFKLIEKKIRKNQKY